jgi:hypothetical protein
MPDARAGAGPSGPETRAAAHAYELAIAQL